MTYFDRFFEEKELPYQSWTLIGRDGTVHSIDSDVVIEGIKHAPAGEQKKIKETLMALDFLNRPITNYLKFLATCMIKVREDEKYT